jgi:hypothetical protein
MVGNGNLEALKAQYDQFYVQLRCVVTIGMKYKDKRNELTLEIVDSGMQNNQVQAMRAYEDSMKATITQLVPTATDI